MQNEWGCLKGSQKRGKITRKSSRIDMEAVTARPKPQKRTGRDMNTGPSSHTATPAGYGKAALI